MCIGSSLSVGFRATSRSRVSQRAAVLIAFICVLSLSGCGSKAKGPKREAVSGKVTREGHDVESGTLTFIPTGGGPAATATIVNGKYKLDGTTGPVAGRQKVEIVHFPKRDFKPGVPKKDADVVPDTRFTKEMPKSGWVMEVEVQPGQKEPLDFEVDK